MEKAIIIGGTSGIGRGLAEYYATNGYMVGVTGRRNELLKELQQTYTNIHIKAFDVLAPDATQMLDELIKEMGGVDLAIISSGAGRVNPKLDAEIEDRTVQTNVVGFTRMADYLFNYFKQQGHGQLAAISSIASVRGLSFSPAYSASKAYIAIYLEALRGKAKKENKKIRISTILPGFVDTAFISKDTPTFWKADVKTVVRQITARLRRKRRKIYTTRRWRWVAMLWRLIPSWLHEKFL